MFPAALLHSGLRPEDSVLDGAHGPDDTCSICLDSFSDDPAIRLVHCTGHYFHRQCIEQAFMRKTRCPVCSQIYFPLFGNQPPGQMLTQKTDDISLPGYDGIGAIIIHYIFPSGVQGPDHYHPSTAYDGTERIAYLPQSPEGGAHVNSQMPQGGADRWHVDLWVSLPKPEE